MMEFTARRNTGAAQAPSRRSYGFALHISQRSQLA